MTQQTTESGNLSITKVVGQKDYVSVEIRHSGGKTQAQIPLEQFAAALFGLAEVPCKVRQLTGKFHKASNT